MRMFYNNGYLYISNQFMKKCSF